MIVMSTDHAKQTRQYNLIIDLGYVMMYDGIPLWGGKQQMALEQQYWIWYVQLQMSHKQKLKKLFQSKCVLYIITDSSN